MRRPLSPVTARYLLARLRPLSRPAFWAPSIALMFVLLFTWQYWMRPEWMSYFGLDSADGNNRLSSENRAIGADIDTLPLLFNDFKLSANPPSKQPDPVKSTPATLLSTDLGNLPKIPMLGASTLSSQPSNLSGLGNLGSVFSRTVQQFGLPTNGSPNSSARSGQSAVTATQSPTLDPLFGFPIGTSTANLSQPTSTNYGSSPKLPVTSANNRSPQTPYGSTSIVPPVPIEGATSLGSFGVNAAPTNPYTNSYTNIVEGTQPASRGATVVPGAVAPSIVPASPSVGQSPLSPQPPNSPSFNAAPSPYGQQQPQVPINDAPFTTPRPIPGQVLGGGEINTFSNP